MSRYRITVQGVVQGVGFRPYVKRLADRLQLNGVVRNTGAGVAIEFDAATSESADVFLNALRREAPPLARIEESRLEEVEAPLSQARAGFTIEPSRGDSNAFTLVSPDIAICADCLREFHDPADRRYRYPFINCTNCGPRYTIIQQTPYDRPNTTMGRFAMCADCEAEYLDPADRRFHAEPVACPVCGPRLESPIEDAIAALKRSEIVAVKSLGGFQLACDALSESAVKLLRERKRRGRKPFAVMMRDLATVERFCTASEMERELLGDAAAPIVILNMREKNRLPPDVAPGLDEIGVMLPYTPLHQLLFDSELACLVMTSGNRSEEPIVISNEEARTRLAGLADHYLMHDRDIFMRADDSVSRVMAGRARIARRARGYAPAPIDLDYDFGEVLACGAELKNTFCLTKGKYAILSQHIGDLENFETLRFFEETLRNLKSVYHASPRLIAHDLHPDYLSTRWAREQALPRIAVQHHHAHVASCMAENGIHEPVIGIAFDGTGYGSDGQIWGGEFLICGYEGFERAAHFRYVPLIGGDRAARECWRAAAAHLYDAFGEQYRAIDLPLWKCVAPVALRVASKVLGKPALLTSSCGRLFDAVAAITSVCESSSYEGEAAMRLEAAAEDAGDRSYSFLLDETTRPWTIDTRPAVREIVQDYLRGCTAGNMAGVFHRTIGVIMKTLCLRLRERTGLNKVCLSGGTFQNRLLLSFAVAALRAEGFEVFLHALTPANDGGISLGQAAVAACLAEREGK